MGKNPLTDGRVYRYFKLVTHIYSLFTARFLKIQLVFKESHYQYLIVEL